MARNTSREILVWDQPDGSFVTNIKTDNGTYVGFGRPNGDTSYYELSDSGKTKLDFSFGNLFLGNDD
jgi:hypothetical protein